MEGIKEHINPIPLFLEIGEKRIFAGAMHQLESQALAEKRLIYEFEVMCGYSMV